MQLIAIFLANQAKAAGADYEDCDTTGTTGCTGSTGSKCVTAKVDGNTVVWTETNLTSTNFCMPVAANNACNVNIDQGVYALQAASNTMCKEGTTCYFGNEAVGTAVTNAAVEGVCVLEDQAECGTVNLTGAPCLTGSNCLTSTLDDATVIFADGIAAESGAKCIAEGTDGCQVTFAASAITSVEKSCAPPGAGVCTFVEDLSTAAEQLDGSCASTIPSGDLLAAYQLCTVGTNECNTESQCVTGAIVDKVVTWTAATDSDVSYCIPTSKDPLVCNVQIADSAYAIDGQADAGTMCAADSLVCTLDDEAKEGDDNPGTCKASPSSSNASIAMATTLVIALTGFLF